MFYRTCGKRFLDLALTGIALLVLSPALLLVALAVRLSSPGPVFYPQERLGKDGKVIRVLKFRSMTDRADRKPGEAGELLGDHDEITAVGRWIRRFKVDELPQLLSVFRGDMSLIGPRPCLPELAGQFNADGRKRLQVRPGCSGLAQVNGNIYLPWPERWQYDAYYVDHLTFLLDLRIALRTAWLVLRGEERLLVPFEEFQRTAQRRR